ncbi:MAG: restriction endonuclease, partial [Sulfuricellaceae bacterium]|nr:restriction endonuclease [Sulfuricellaceae bacterium]
VYQTLLDLKGEKVLVARDVTIRGRNNLDPQIDVYYEFELAGIRHQVAIECKNMQRPLDKDRVMAFCSKVNDCPGMRGIIVAAHGYQSGAKKFAEDNGVSALVLSDLPSIGRLLGMRLETVAIPTETTIGQPFWTLFELDTGAPAGHQQDGETYGVLFFSKKQAEAYFAARSYGAGWAVRGLSQENLRTYILTVDAMAGRFLLVQSAGNFEAASPFVAQEIERQTLISEFYVGTSDIPDEPMVMPSIAKRRENRT